MKNLLVLFVAAASFGIGSCKKSSVDRMTVLRDCTGTYLRMDGKDYQVCNEEKTDPFPSGTEVTASFKSIAYCNPEDGRIRCNMFRPKEGCIEVLSIH